MGLLEPITHKEEIEGLISEAQSKYNSSLKKFDDQKVKTTKSLEKLGKVKIEAWTNEMDSFVDSFGFFNNIEIVQTIDTNMGFIGSDEKPQQMIVNMRQASLTANEVAKAGFAAIGTGALVGIASYGGAMMFGTASTGAAIAALSGAAKTNATLAFFGGGSKAVGGLGIAGGKVVLAGIVAAPILAVAAVITSVKSKERLAEAKKIHAEAMDAVAKMDIMTTGMSGIEKMSDNYSGFITKFKKKFRPFLKELDRIRAAHPTADGEMIDYNELSIVEQKTLHLAWLMAQIFYHVLSTPILTADGKVSEEAGKVISVAQKEFTQFKRDTFKMTGDDAKAADILWMSSAKTIMVVNFIAVVAMLYAGVRLITTSFFAGAALFVSAFIAFPVFFKLQAPSASKLLEWRIARLVGAVVFAIVMLIIIL